MLDLSQMNVNENKYVSDIPLPEGVISTIALQGRNEVVVSISNPRANEPETPAAGEAAAAPAAKAPAAK